MGGYSGPLLEAADLTEPDMDARCGDDIGHAIAIGQTIFAIVGGQRITLTRRRLHISHDEIPGVVTGRVYGMSNSGEGVIILGLELDDGTGIGVDVSNPRDWHWEVH